MPGKLGKSIGFRSMIAILIQSMPSSSDLSGFFRLHLSALFDMAPPVSRLDCMFAAIRARSRRHEFANARITAAGKLCHAKHVKPSRKHSPAARLRVHPSFPRHSRFRLRAHVCWLITVLHACAAMRVAATCPALGATRLAQAIRAFARSMHARMLHAAMLPRPRSIVRVYSHARAQAFLFWMCCTRIMHTAIFILAI